MQFHQLENESREPKVPSNADQLIMDVNIPRRPADPIIQPVADASEQNVNADEILPRMPRTPEKTTNITPESLRPFAKAGARKTVQRERKPGEDFVSDDEAMLTLYVDDPASVGVQGSLAPRPSGAPPSDLSTSSAPVEPEPKASDVDAHLALLAEAVGREALQSVSFGLSKRGFPVIYVKGQKFLKHEGYRDRVRWTCSRRVQAGCRANLTTLTVTGDIVRSFLEHTHT
ncbi:hypothetical protein JYU34_004357 [Plutella xylostella]|uniref:FLYWCH-type domain-containing protein n=1 Tax=Plutella xylostella TaxID=51655 RepID=A0ABQ7QXU7_PLUXY|nr:hypothetical protein JYU34_004357 [Plutella xylostella]